MIALLPSCDESTGSVGIGMIEDDDIVTPGRKTFPIELENMLVDKDSVSNKSLLAYVGKFTDETFGELETSYMTQLFCLDDFRFDFDRIVKDTVWENGPGSAIKISSRKEPTKGKNHNSCHQPLMPKSCRRLVRTDKSKTCPPSSMKAKMAAYNHSSWDIKNITPTTCTTMISPICKPSSHSQ